jgi:Ca2+/Na+ antiporter
MNGSNFMHGWVAIAGSLAIIALILTAFGLMLGIVKPADALRRVGAILGVVMLLMVLPAILVSIWSSMSLWQQIGIASLAIIFLSWGQARKTSRRYKK